MKKLMINIGIQLGGSAVAILLAALILRRFSLGLGGFITAVVIFTIAQSVLVGVVAKLATKYTPALVWAASLVSTWLALVISNIPLGGIRIHGFMTWIWATLIVWAVTALCAVVIPKYVLKDGTRT